MTLTQQLASERSYFERLVHSGQARDYLNSLSDEEKEALLFQWEVHRRPKQTPPDWDWRVWLILAGRGFGKTRTGAEFIRDLVRTGEAQSIALVGRTRADVRDTMILGDSGILAISPKGERPRYVPARRRLIWPNGAIAITYSADQPDQLRGPNHDLAWADEVAAWRYPEAWDMLMLGLRIGTNPRIIATTTPRPTKLIKSLAERNDVALTVGSTYENRANLAGSFMTEVLQRYEGTRLGRQELHAEILNTTEGALWTNDTLEAGRTTSAPDLKRIVVAVDPATGAGPEAAETGIVVCALGEDGDAYILDDKSVRGSPNDWGKAVVTACNVWEADRIIAEANQGGEMVRHTIQTVDPNAPIKMVHASRGKRTRAEPVAALYEQQRVHHVGFFDALEQQMCEWVPDVSPSPDRLDAMVWGITELILGGPTHAPVVMPQGMTAPSQWRL